MYNLFARGFLVIFCWFSYALSSSAETWFLEKEYLISSFPAKWCDTLFRFYRYSSHGFVSSITDSPRINDLSYATYEAKCDSVGRIIKVSSCRNAPNLPEYAPKVITKYHWLADHIVAFSSRDTNDAVLDTGVIQAFGKIRIVRLPQNETLPTVNETQLIVVVSDSTCLFSKDGSLADTYYWQFDSLGNDTSWHYRKPGGKKQWVNSYTNVYDENGLLDRRSPAMMGSKIKYIYSSQPVRAFSLGNGARQRYVPHIYKQRQAVRSFAYLLNGRRIPLSIGFHFGNICIAASSEETPSTFSLLPVVLRKTRE